MAFAKRTGVPTFIAIVITILILAVVIGGINGVVTTVFGVPSLITTLGTVCLGTTIGVSARS